MAQDTYSYRYFTRKASNGWFVYDRKHYSGEMAIAVFWKDCPDAENRARGLIAVLNARSSTDPALMDDSDDQGQVDEVPRVIRLWVQGGKANILVEGLPSKTPFTVAAGDQWDIALNPSGYRISVTGPDSTKSVQVEPKPADRVFDSSTNWDTIHQWHETDVPHCGNGILTYDSLALIQCLSCKWKAISERR